MNFNYLIIRLSIGGDEDPDSPPKRLEGKAEERAIFRLEFQRRNRPTVCGVGGAVASLEAESLGIKLDCEMLSFHFCLKSKIVQNEMNPSAC